MHEKPALNLHPIPRRPNPERRREIIIETATCSVAAEGFEGLSMVRLSRACDMPSRTIGTLFPSKHYILLEICERHMDALVTAAERADLPRNTTRRRLDGLAVALVTTACSRNDAHRALRIGRQVLSPPLRRDFDRKRIWLATLLAEALAASMPGVLRRPKYANAAIESLLTLLFEDPPAGLAADVYARFCVTCILEGLRGDRVRNGSR